MTEELTKVCRKCKVEQPITKFRKMPPKARAGKIKIYTSGVCTPCIVQNNTKNINKDRESYNLRIRNKRKQRKEWAVEYKGGKCSKCELTFHPAAYDFHHLDPNEKDFNPCNLLTCSIKRIKEELDKCVLLCSNCHRILHYEEGY
jgi:hypothetical protein